MNHGEQPKEESTSLNHQPGSIDGLRPISFANTHRPQAAPTPQGLAEDGHLLVDVPQARLPVLDLDLALWFVGWPREERVFVCLC